jgi:hypothetical protein
VTGFATVSVQDNNQISQAVPASQLSEHHAKKLIPATEMLYVLVAVITGDYGVKNSLRQKID